MAGIMGGYISPQGGGGFSNASGVITSGSIGDNTVYSGSIASGQVGWPHLASGAVQSGDIANSAVVSGSYSSGSISRFAIASGSLTGFELGSGSIVSGRIASGQVSKFHFSSGSTIDSAEWLIEDTFTAGEPISGGGQAVGVAFSQSGILQTAMASVSGRMPAVGVAIANFTSGQAVALYRAGRVFSTSFSFSGWMNQTLYVGASGHVVASGSPSASGNILQPLGVSISQSGALIQIGGAFQAVLAGSGDIGSGAILGQAGGGYFNIASGSIGANDLASGSVVSGRIASGQIGGNHLAQGAIGAGSLASGSLAPYDHSSGDVTRAAGFVVPFQSGLNWGIPNLITQETISGVRAVCISQSGNLRIAMASVSGRMPAIGLVVDNILSGIPANVYTQGAFQLSSGVSDYSGYLGKPVWVGPSGHVVTFSGSWNSGGFNVGSGGDFVQRFGTVVNSGAFILNPDSTLLQNQLLGINDLVDVVNRGFGV